MFVARHKESGLFLKNDKDNNHLQVPLEKAKVYASEQGARHSITWGVPGNARLLDSWDILPITVAIEESK